MHRVVDHELGRDQRVDARRVAAELRHRVAHRREVDDGGHAGEVLHDDARRRERDLACGQLAGSALASARMSSRETLRPSSWRSRFSSRIFSE
jgi:hypothetical protein